MFAIIAWAFLALFVAIILHWIYFLLTQPKDLPPGPLPLPIIGNCWMFAYRDAVEVFQELYKKYGGAVTLYSGCTATGRMVLLMDWDIIYETFCTAKYADGVNGRPHDIATLRGVREGFGWAKFEVYKERRKFTIRCFKELGLASQKLTPHAFDELDRLQAAIEDKKGEPFNPAELLSESVGSCILMTVFGRRLDLKDPEMSNLYHAGRHFFEGNAFQMLMLPYVKFFQLISTDILAIGERMMENTMERWIVEEEARRRPTFNPEAIRDMVDAYIASDPKGALIHPQFARMLVDLFLGAMDTTSTAIGWAIYYLSFMPDEQERLFKHIESVVPANSYPLLEYKDKLPRIAALISEVHRYGNQTYVGLPRCSTTDEVTFEVKNKRYVVPIGDAIWFTNYISQHDEKYWLDPYNFRIDRWLTPEGEYKPHTHWFQFGIGRRCCIGEQVAHNLLFFYMTFIIQRFHWRQSTDLPFDAFKRRITKVPPPLHQIIFTKRD